MSHRLAALRPIALIAVTVAAGIALAGCSDDDSFANDPRPPAPITVTAVIGADRVSVSPPELGAGPIELIVANQTQAAQRLTLSGGPGGQASEQTAPINPDETTSLKVSVAEGEYAVGVTGGGIEDAPLVVGPSRPSAQNDLLQP